MTPQPRFIAALLALALAVSACGSSSSTPAHVTKTVSSVSVVKGSASAATKPISGHTTVAIRNYMFTPMRLVVRAGTKVSFHNFDQTAHTATAINQSFDSGTIQPGKTATVAFTKPGTYAYRCLFHEFMTAKIIVLPAHG